MARKTVTIKNGELKMVSPLGEVLANADNVLEAAVQASLEAVTPTETAEVSMSDANIGRQEVSAPIKTHQAESALTVPIFTSYTDNVRRENDAKLATLNEHCENVDNRRIALSRRIQDQIDALQAEFRHADAELMAERLDIERAAAMISAANTAFDKSR